MPLSQVRHDTTVSGEHRIHLTISGVAIKRSPIAFTVQPDKPDPQSCKLSSGPVLCSGKEMKSDHETLYADLPYACLLRTFDKYGNACVTGGAKFGTRLQLVKQSAHDQTALVPQNHSIEVDDLQDGTYHITTVVNFPCSVKLFVNMDKNLPASAGELPPTNLTLVKNPDADKAKLDRGSARVTAAPAVEPPKERRASTEGIGNIGSVFGGLFGGNAEVPAVSAPAAEGAENAPAAKEAEDAAAAKAAEESAAAKVAEESAAAKAAEAAAAAKAAEDAAAAKAVEAAASAKAAPSAPPKAVPSPAPSAAFAPAPSSTATPPPALDRERLNGAKNKAAAEAGAPSAATPGGSSRSRRGSGSAAGSKNSGKTSNRSTPRKQSAGAK